MKITEETICKIPEKEQGLVRALLKDVDEINEFIFPKDKKIYLNWIDEHTEYSPEWTDPCPDFYGMYTVRREGVAETIGVEMDLDTLDTALCLLNNFVVYD